jgi:hypothetical protein
MQMKFRCNSFTTLLESARTVAEKVCVHMLEVMVDATEKVEYHRRFRLTQTATAEDMQANHGRAEELHTQRLRSYPSVDTTYLARVRHNVRAASSNPEEDSAVAPKDRATPVATPLTRNTPIPHIDAMDREHFAPVINAHVD